jgi:hypothetical protein
MNMGYELTDRDAAAQHTLLIEPHALGGQGAALDAHAGALRRCLGAWSTEYGPLNHLVTLWEGAADPGGQVDTEQAPQDWLAPRPASRRLLPRRALRPGLLDAPFMELRMYAARPGQCDRFLDAMLAALPLRERHSPCVAIWKSEQRGVDLVVHLWAYDSLDQRMAARSAAGADAEWGAYRASIRPLLDNMQAWLLLPAALPKARTQ